MLGKQTTVCLPESTTLKLQKGTSLTLSRILLNWKFDRENLKIFPTNTRVSLSHIASDGIVESDIRGIHRGCMHM